jgi:hypothetical protein
MALFVTQSQMQSLRLTYDAAYTAYRSCVEALSKGSMAAETPSPDLLLKEATALRELTQARANLLVAMRNLPDQKSA